MTINKLTDKACRQKAGAHIKRLGDGGGMFLEIHPNGRRYWRMAYRFGGKQKQLAFGVFPDVPVATARQKRDEARALLAGGINPTDHRDQQEREAIKLAAATKTLSELSDDWFLVKMEREGKDDATQTRNRSLLRYLKAAPLGSRPAAEIEAPEILTVLRKIEKRGLLETAHRVQRIASRIFKFGVATGACSRDPAADLSEALAEVKVEKRPAITDPTEFGKLLRKMRVYDGATVTCEALEMLALTMVRPGEVRKMEWSEIDIEEKTWRIPASKMKMRVAHEVSLSRQALEIFDTVRPITGSGQYVFGVKGGSKPFSDATLGKALRSMGIDTRTTHCAHGFRSTASTMLNGERRPDGDPMWHPDIVELCLAHVDDNSVRGIYNRSKLWPERVHLMQAWADRIDTIRSGAKVLKMGKRA